MAQSNGQAVLVTSAFGPARATGSESSVHTEFDPKNFERLPALDVPVGALSPGVSLRQGGTDAAHIQLLVEVAGSAELPPVLVQVDGYRVIDGLHRLEAAKVRGDASIKARFLDCSDSEALVIAMKANGTHGLPLAKADRVCGAQRVLRSHPDWSDRAIAQITGLSAKTIAALRDRSADAVPLDGKRIGRDGRRRPVDPGEGRRRAAEYIVAHPHAPLRQVARETDVSLGTVHDVSARLRRGDSPERDRRQTPVVGRGQEQGQAPSDPGMRPVPAIAPVPSIHAVPSVASIQAVPSVPSPSSPPSSPPSVWPVSPLRRSDAPVRPGGAGAAGAGRTPLVVAPSPGAVPHRRNHVDAPPAWATVAAKMANDPAIRYTAGGRDFLRWMQVHATDPGEDWRQLVDAVPPHWRGVIATIAERIGKEWSLLAERLKSDQDLAL